VKIRDDHGLPRGVTPQTRQVRAAQDERWVASPAVQPPAEDRVELSDRARALQVAQGALSQLPEVRTERVEAVKSLVQSGRYQVPSEVLAERMLGEGLFV
jgi:flagellar biosynthesis anti-sigma factor FlgM